MGVEVVLTLLVELLGDILDKVVLEEDNREDNNREEESGGERSVSCEGEMCT